MDGCISYPSSGSIRVRTISMSSNSSSYPSSYPRQRRRNKKRGRNSERKKKKKKRTRVSDRFSSSSATCFMCLSTDQLKFLDMTNYIAPGFSYDKYLKAYGCEVTKGHFPYEYMDRLERLRSTTERGLLQSTVERRYFR